MLYPKEDINIVNSTGDYTVCPLALPFLQMLSGQDRQSVSHSVWIVQMVRQEFIVSTGCRVVFTSAVLNLGQM